MRFLRLLGFLIVGTPFFILSQAYCLIIGLLTLPIEYFTKEEMVNGYMFEPSATYFGIIKDIIENN